MEEETLDPIWKALADPTRRRLLDLLKGEPRTTGDLAAAFPRLSRFAVMKHLSILEEVGLVVVRRRGRERWNHLNAAPIRAIAERWIGPYEALWAGSLLRLRQGTRQPEESSPMPTATEAPSPLLRRIQIEQEIVIAAPPLRVFAALTDEVGRWWDHAFAPTPRAIRLEPVVGGRFYQEWDDTAGTLYATVTRVRPGAELTMVGPMGMRGPVQGVIEFAFEPHDGGTLLKLSHRALGELDDETERTYGEGWTRLLHRRLKPFVETGRPEA